MFLLWYCLHSYSLSINVSHRRHSRGVGAVLGAAPTDPSFCISGYYMIRLWFGMRNLYCSSEVVALSNTSAALLLE